MKLPVIGDYPSAYKPEVHGPYFPGRYYGKPDTPFGDVKLRELPAWIGRRDKSVRGTVSLICRGMWRWAYKYQSSNCPSGFGIFIVQWCAMVIPMYYLVNYSKHALHRHAKYH